MGSLRRYVLLFIAMASAFPLVFAGTILFRRQLNVAIHFLIEDVIATYAFGYLIGYGTLVVMGLFILGVVILTGHAILTRVRRVV